MTETRVTPWYRDTVELDRRRNALYNAFLEGRPEPQPTDPRVHVTDALAVAMMYDADLFRAWLEILSVQALPQEIMARPGVVDRIMQVASTLAAVIPPGAAPVQLLRTLHPARR